MAEPFTLDGNTLQASYEHVRRSVEFQGFPYAGWSEITGGGIHREGQAHVFGAGDAPRGVTDGRAVPQDLTARFEVYLWQSLKGALIAQALLFGDNSETNYQKVEWQIVDQWRGANPLQPTLTRTYTVKVKNEDPDTKNDGSQTYYELVLVPVGLPQETYGT